MRKSLHHLIAKLHEDGTAYATATVVRRTSPSSGKPGDHAIITPEGKIHGWIGGGCTRGIVLKESLTAIADGRPRFVRISPTAGESVLPNTQLYTMTCQSGGSVDLYIEPTLPMPKIVIMGRSHIGMALVRIAQSMNYQVLVANDHPDSIEYPSGTELIGMEELTESHINDHNYVVVCTQGHGDEIALEKALRSSASYLAFVSSRKKAGALFGEMRKRGITLEELKKVKTPAGIDIGAKTPDEVAISILAEIIQDIRQKAVESDPTEASASEPQHFAIEDYYINPVCGIPVHMKGAKHVIDHQGDKVYFCCDGCMVKFKASPSQYIKA